jgi:outer membrane protein OmpA-like peptidoglycan-associated protein
MRVLVSVGMALLMSGCASTPELANHDPVRHAIGWINRQFLTCPESKCPSPTRKTLAVVDLPARAQKSPDSVKAVDVVPKVTPPQETVEKRTVHFQFGKAVPTPQGLKAILDLSAVAKAATRIELDGRTDDIGSKAVNDRLARLRAEHVRDWLLSEGVKAPIALTAEGACCFADSDKTESARQRNRRVEVRLVHRVLGRDAVGNKQGAQ